MTNDTRESSLVTFRVGPVHGRAAAVPTPDGLLPPLIHVAVNCGRDDAVYVRSDAWYEAGVTLPVYVFRGLQGKVARLD